MNIISKAMGYFTLKKSDFYLNDCTYKDCLLVYGFYMINNVVAWHKNPFSRCISKAKHSCDLVLCALQLPYNIFNIYANESNKRKYGKLPAFSRAAVNEMPQTYKVLRIKVRELHFPFNEKRERESLFSFPKWCASEKAVKRRRPWGQKKLAANFTASLGCLRLCPRWPEAYMHHWSKPSRRGQWPWMGLKDANIGSKWLVILLEHAVGGGPAVRGLFATDAIRCLYTHRQLVFPWMHANAWTLRSQPCTLKSWFNPNTTI